MERKLQSKRKLSVPSNSSLVAPSCRYNLRNRGPAPFTKMAEQECPICFSSVYEAPVVLNCGHTICGVCITRVLKKYKNCPICNTILIKRLFLNDTSYTRKLTTRNLSPDKSTTRSAVRAVKSEPRDLMDSGTSERLARKRPFQRQDRTPERSVQQPQQQPVTAGGSMALSVTPLARPGVNKVMTRVVY